MQDRSSSGLICRAKSTFSTATEGASFGFFATTGFSVVVPGGRASVIASTAQLVPAAEIQESRPWGKPLSIVGWNGYARLTTCYSASAAGPSRHHADDAVDRGRGPEFGVRVVGEVADHIAAADVGVPTRIGVNAATGV